VSFDTRRTLAPDYGLTDGKAVEVSVRLAGEFSQRLESAFVAGRAVRALGGRAGPRCRSRLRGPALRKRQKRGHQVDVVVSL
jgi:hypothetical protein